MTDAELEIDEACRWVEYHDDSSLVGDLATVRCARLLLGEVKRLQAENAGLREIAVVEWSDEAPTTTGLYWMRWPPREGRAEGAPRQANVTVDYRRELTVEGFRASEGPSTPRDLALHYGVQWAPFVAPRSAR